MRYKDRFTKGRLVCFILSCLLSFAVITLGVILLLRGAIINISFLIAFLIFPLAYSAGCYFLIFGNIKAYWKIILFIPLLGLTMCLLLFSLLFGIQESILHYSGDKALEHYSEEFLHKQAFPAMPEIGEPVHIEFHEYDYKAAIFYSSADTLICQYSGEDYCAQKSSLENTYTFQTEPITSSGTTCIPTAQIDGYSFRMLTETGKKEWDMQFPKSIALIATNDTTLEIVYIAFYDQDLDYIDSLTDFINKYCGWEHIR